MQCKKCRNESIMTANYCCSCGAPFSEEERQSAYDKTIFGILDKIADMKSWIDLSKFTGNRIVRILFLALLLALVIINVNRNGSHLSIQKSPDYTVTYSQETSEYYVLTEKEEISLNAYLPKATDTITISCYINGVQNYSVQKTPDAEINLARIDNGYYVMRADYEDGSAEEMMFFVCEGDTK